jgi:predicted glutamine amidotransferase
MCRIACFPPLFPQDKALEILLDFEHGNTDGVGSVHVQDGEFVVNKYPKSLSRVLKKDFSFLGHMPYNGWTLAHLRAASHGCNADRNTHPFVMGDMALIHNGIWSEYKIAKMILNNKKEIQGETDSEIAAHVISRVGPKKFGKVVDYGGVFAMLYKNGEMWVVKTSGDLAALRWKGKTLLASELDFEYRRQKNVNEGWFHFGIDGKLIDFKHYRESYMAPSGSYSKLKRVSLPLPSSPTKPRSSAVIFHKSYGKPTCRAEEMHEVWD